MTNISSEYIQRLYPVNYKHLPASISSDYNYPVDYKPCSVKPYFSDYIQ